MGDEEFDYEVVSVFVADDYFPGYEDAANASAGQPSRASDEASGVESEQTAPPAPNEHSSSPSEPPASDAGDVLDAGASMPDKSEQAEWSRLLHAVVAASRESPPTESSFACLSAGGKGGARLRRPEAGLGRDTEEETEEGLGLLSLFITEATYERIGDLGRVDPAVFAAAAVATLESSLRRLAVAFLTLLLDANDEAKGYAATPADATQENASKHLPTLTTVPQTAADVVPWAWAVFGEAFAALSNQFAVLVEHAYAVTRTLLAMLLRISGAAESNVVVRSPNASASPASLASASPNSTPHSRLDELLCRAAVLVLLPQLAVAAPPLFGVSEAAPADGIGSPIPGGVPSHRLPVFPFVRREFSSYFELETSTRAAGARATVLTAAEGSATPLSRLETVRAGNISEGQAAVEGAVVDKEAAPHEVSADPSLSTPSTGNGSIPSVPSAAVVVATAGEELSPEGVPSLAGGVSTTATEEAASPVGYCERSGTWRRLRTAVEKGAAAESESSGRNAGGQQQSTRPSASVPLPLPTLEAVGLVADDLFWGAIIGGAASALRPQWVSNAFFGTWATLAAVGTIVDEGICGALLAEEGLRVVSPPFSADVVSLVVSSGISSPNGSASEEAGAPNSATPPDAVVSAATANGLGGNESASAFGNGTLISAVKTADLVASHSAGGEEDLVSLAEGGAGGKQTPPTQTDQKGSISGGSGSGKGSRQATVVDTAERVLAAVRRAVCGRVMGHTELLRRRRGGRRVKKDPTAHSPSANASSPKDEGKPADGDNDDDEDEDDYDDPFSGLNRNYFTEQGVHIIVSPLAKFLLGLAIAAVWAATLVAFRLTRSTMRRFDRLEAIAADQRRDFLRIRRAQKRRNAATATASMASAAPPLGSGGAHTHQQQHRGPSPSPLHRPHRPSTITISASTSLPPGTQMTGVAASAPSTGVFSRGELQRVAMAGPTGAARSLSGAYNASSVGGPNTVAGNGSAPPSPSTSTRHLPEPSALLAKGLATPQKASPSTASNGAQSPQLWPLPSPSRTQQHQPLVQLAANSSSGRSSRADCASTASGAPAMAPPAALHLRTAPMMATLALSGAAAARTPMGSHGPSRSVSPADSCGCGRSDGDGTSSNGAPTTARPSPAAAAVPFSAAGGRSGSAEAAGMPVVALSPHSTLVSLSRGEDPQQPQRLRNNTAALPPPSPRRAGRTADAYLPPNSDGGAEASAEADAVVMPLPRKATGVPPLAPSPARSQHSAGFSGRPPTSPIQPAAPPSSGQPQPSSSSPAASSRGPSHHHHHHPQQQPSSPGSSRFRIPSDDGSSIDFALGDAFPSPLLGRRGAASEAMALDGDSGPILESFASSSAGAPSSCTAAGSAAASAGERRSAGLNASDGRGIPPPPIDAAGVRSSATTSGGAAAAASGGGEASSPLSADASSSMGVGDASSSRAISSLLDS